MNAYGAPLSDMTFALVELAGLREVAALPGFEEAGPETTGAILDEAAKSASEVLGQTVMHGAASVLALTEEQF
jgi:hypothetical protein